MVGGDVMRSIRIMDGEDTIEHASCRIVVLPDGREGAVSQGLAYPILTGERIDRAGYAVAAGLCTPARVRGNPFALLASEGGTYVFIAGVALAFDEAVARLRQAGLAIRRAGRYLGEPIDGVAADWFIRLDPGGSVNEVDALLAPILGAGQAPQSAATPDQQQLRLVLADLQASRAREARLRKQVAMEQAQATSAAAEAELARLAEELAAERAARATAEAELARLASGDITRPIAQPAKQPKMAREIELLFKCLLTDIELLRESAAVIAVEYAERQPLYRALAELREATGRLPPGWKSFQAGKAWWERHVSTGQDSTGRLYTRRSPERGGWQVLVSFKADQARDEDWLKQQ